MYMSNLEVSNTTTDGRYEISISVKLGELDQPIITAKKPTGWEVANGKWKQNEESRKFVVQTIYYNFYSWHDTTDFKISSLVGVYFLKNSKKTGSKLGSINLDVKDPADFNEIVNQIPAKLHDYAKEKLKEIEATLKEVLDKGVITNA